MEGSVNSLRCAVASGSAPPFWQHVGRPSNAGTGQSPLPPALSHGAAAVARRGGRRGAPRGWGSKKNGRVPSTTAQTAKTRLKFYLQY